MLQLTSLGAGLSTIIGGIRERAENIISTLINLFRQILDYIYTWMLRLWTFIMENPRGAITLFANLWVMML